jgi:hypothetical protein
MNSQRRLTKPKRKSLTNLQTKVKNGSRGTFCAALHASRFCFPVSLTFQVDDDNMA